MDRRDFAIGVLSTSAIILFVGVLIVGTQPQGAQAGAMTTTNGEYVLTVGPLTMDNEELVFVLNAPTEKMVAYRFDNSKRNIEVVQGIDLAEMRKAATTTQPPQKPQRGGNRP